MGNGWASYSTMYPKVDVRGKCTNDDGSTSCVAPADGNPDKVRLLCLDGTLSLKNEEKRRIALTETGRCGTGGCNQEPSACADATSCEAINDAVAITAIGFDGGSMALTNSDKTKRWGFRCVPLACPFL